MSGPVVLQVMPTLAHASDRIALDIAGAVHHEGGTALIASSGGPFVAELPRSGARHHRITLDRRNPLGMLASASKLVRLIRSDSVDIVHARGLHAAWPAYLAARRTAKPFVTTFDLGGPADGAFDRFYAAALARGDRVIAVSEFAARLAYEQHKVDDRRLRLVRRGIDTETFDPSHVTAPRMIRLARLWGLPDDLPVLMLPGRLMPHNGHALLIDALARIKNRAFHCLVVGAEGDDPGYSGEIEERARAAGLNGRFHIVPECRDMAAAYMLADVVLSAAPAPEAFSLVLAEAQAMGRPVVSIDRGSAREQVAGNEMAWLVPPEDPAALASAIGRALDLDPDLRARLAAETAQRAQARYARTTMCAGTLAVYRELMERPSPHPAPALTEASIPS
ncbi:MAG TPA: glycosyltransferase [Hypericibacter adhaerens]|uniref:Glycosyl transferase n=1 Tax=Hypericibacter adhaerens TaxID=2602016 RepID=A0A5J6MVY7_9PROT|nr:glycosyltransferase [Hypericibacter adhaerens]QEX20320.1 glycosyl transferase [Hypericibacter adhaerens]HWA41838.1 glycosyltransferase [Hypericibacter adhaerens]